MNTRIPLVLASLLLASSLPSCMFALGAGAAGTGVAYLMGDLEATLEGTPEEVTRATEAVFEDMQLHHVSARNTSIDGEITGERSDDTKIIVRVQRESDDLSKLWIRIGTFGNEDQSRAIFERIREKM